MGFQSVNEDAIATAFVVIMSWYVPLVFWLFRARNGWVLRQSFCGPSVVCAGHRLWLCGNFPSVNSDHGVAA